MDLYEYQGKQFFADYGIPVPRGVVVSSVEETPDLPNGGVVKTQVLTGGRGKAGGVAVCQSSAEVQDAVHRLLGTVIKGHAARRLLVEERIEIEHEYYMSIFINRKNQVPSLMFSDQGGMNIESVAKENIKIVDINPLLGIYGYMIRELLSQFQIEHKDQITEIITKAYRLFKEKKLQLLEINPLVQTKNGEIVALDSKITMDDWAIDSSVDVAAQEGGNSTEFERELLKHGMTAVEMEGDVVVYSSGAGVAMATADCIKNRGASLRAVIDENTLPAARDDEELRNKAAAVMRRVLDLKPKVILINMHFQAGMCDLEAKTIKLAFEEAAKTMPIIARFKGRRADEAVEVLKGTSIYVTQSFKEACDVAVSKL
ncbi:acetate--CoA ligase family protein [Dysosmobacter sp. NSJ-60]|nr:acetate--CoA ligase family protein [Dysosmobacter hominis]MBS5658363.1 acetate--CoA ligase family protein [Oscillibacter sp.]